MTFEQYALLCPDGMEQGTFDRLLPQGSQALHQAVTGVDGVDKLMVAPPKEEQARAAVERCLAALVHTLWQMEQSQGVAVRADGTVTGKVVTGLTAGSESVTYAAPAMDGGLGREAALAATAREHLAGVCDANGVYLLYMGRYPMRII